MGRRIWIIEPKYKTLYRQVKKGSETILVPYQVLEPVSQDDIDAAFLNNCTEIAQGVPPILKGVVNEDSLPVAHEEPDPLPPQPTKLDQELADIKARITALEEKEIA